LLISDCSNLSEQQKKQLAGYLEQYPVLDALYRVKQKLNRLLLIKNSNAIKARKWLPKLLRLPDQLKNNPARRLANTLGSWLEPIVRMWRISKSNGITEGFHTKMEMISRWAYRFKTTECGYSHYVAGMVSLTGFDLCHPPFMEKSRKSGLKNEDTEAVFGKVGMASCSQSNAL
jgi:Transposase